MPHFALLVPGDPATRTGGYIYDRRIVEGLRARGWRVPVHSLDASFPLPTPAALRARHEYQARLARIAESLELFDHVGFLGQ